MDPGVWSEGAALEGVSHVLITHEHADHIDIDRLAAAQVANADLKVSAHTAMTAQLEKLGDAAVTVASGDEFDAGGFQVRVVGGAHAEIYLRPVVRHEGRHRVLAHRGGRERRALGYAALQPCQACTATSMTGPCTSTV
ncbi:MBL fold metallo-hydrolase [Phytohabitans kaempferiae]|uniref:MBL fold metallo-hydrolase n=1 Tax=Phytohabitans kaempferiae TaxID=1620943 RepID=A0ABV6M6N9_9ACTN